MVMGQSHNPIKVSISQFYGIEINDFAVSVARTALWIAESQMMKETEDIVNMNLNFLPLKTYPNIIEGNALRMDWEEIVPKDELDYIMGNPPFVGTRFMDNEQATDLKKVLGNVKGIGKLDYVVGWYKKASELMISSNVRCAFVSTNSITQGEQVAPFWENIFDNNGLKILFAYQTFIWMSEAINKAAVHCVIIGFGKDDYKKKQLYLSNSQLRLVVNISPYLLGTPDFVVKARSKPISNVIEAQTGTRVGAQQYVFTEEEMNTFVENETLSSKYFHEYLGAEEFLNNKKRFCLYLENATIQELNQMPNIRRIISQVLEERKAKNHKLKDFPRQYVKLNIPSQDYIFIPQMSSGRRKYIPIGLISKEVWTADPHFMVQTSDLFYFGVLSSNVHNAWMRVVAGRLKSDYRYSNRIVYNNFVWPICSTKEMDKIRDTSKLIIQARQKNREVSLSDLYEPTKMPTDLIEANRENDKAVMEAYGFDWRNMTESECVTELMKMYDVITKKL